MPTAGSLARRTRPACCQVRKRWCDGQPTDGFICRRAPPRVRPQPQTAGQPRRARSRGCRANDGQPVSNKNAAQGARAAAAAAAAAAPPRRTAAAAPPTPQNKEPEPRRLCVLRPTPGLRKRDVVVEDRTRHTTYTRDLGNGLDSRRELGREEARLLELEQANANLQVRCTPPQARPRRRSAQNERLRMRSRPARPRRILEWRPRTRSRRTS